MLLTLLKKDLLQEIRNPESLVLVFSLGIILSVVVAFGVNSAMLGSDFAEKIFPFLIWIVFVFTATLSVQRSIEKEDKFKGMDGLIVAGVSPVMIFFSKVFFNAILVFLANLICLVVLAVLMNVSVFSFFPGLSFVCLLVALAYSPLSCLTLSISNSSRLKAVILPIIILPLLFPVLSAAIELTYEIFNYKALNLESFWVSLLIGLDVLYIVLGANLYEHVIKES